MNQFDKLFVYLFSKIQEYVSHFIVYFSMISWKVIYEMEVSVP